jgi:hypothetical protein
MASYLRRRGAPGPEKICEIMHRACATAIIRYQPASLEGKNALAMAQTFGAMRDHNDRWTRRGPQNPTKQCVFALYIDGASCFVEHEEIRST